MRSGKYKTLKLAMGVTVLGAGLAAISSLGLAARGAHSTPARSDGAGTANTTIALPGTAPLNLVQQAAMPPALDYPKAPVFVQQLDQVNEYFSRQIAATPAARDKIWHPDYSSLQAYRQSLAPHRARLRKMLGIVEMTPGVARANLLSEKGGVRIEDVTVPLDRDFSVRALLFVPDGTARKTAVIAVPDAGESREQFAGVAAGAAPAAWLTGLLRRGVVVAVPEMVERTSDHALCTQTHLDRRALLYRLGFIVGRTLVGLDVQQAIALRQYLASLPAVDARHIGILGKGQGGMTALYAAAADENLSAAAVVDYFQQRENAWEEPVDRMLYGQLKEFGDAEVAALVAPRPLELLSGSGGPAAASVDAEQARAVRFYRGIGHAGALRVDTAAADPVEAAAQRISQLIGAAHGSAPGASVSLRLDDEQILAARNAQFESLHRYLRRLDAESDAIREKHWNLLATPPSQRAARAAELRKELADLMGVIPRGGVALHPRTELIKVTDKFAAYHVMLDAFPGVEAYGQLLIPRHAKGRLPVVICQHGLGGRPGDITGVSDHPDTVYHSLGSHLADMGYVVFAPSITVPVKQEVLVNPIVRKAATLGMMRTSVEVARLHAIVDFLQTQPYVDSSRIGYYGLSYGGYSATWMPPLEPRLKFTVISGHFNDWRTKITDETNNTSYLLHPDADFYNWDVLHRFTHLELVAAMYPRPVCVEFAERDATTTPEWHARAWAEVKKWAHAWNMDDKIVRDHFDGVHEIHAIGAVDFVNRWLRPEVSAGRDYEYTLRAPLRELPGIAENSEDTQPYVTQALDADYHSEVEGTFYVSNRSAVFSGIALKVAKVGHPGPLRVRFGTRAGAADIGEARLSAASVDPLLDVWHQASIKPVRLDPSRLYHFSLQAEWGRAPKNYYVLYGPRPVGGKDYPAQFAVAYQTVTTDEPLLAAGHEQPFEFLREMMQPYHGGPAMITAGAAARQADEVALGSDWSIVQPAAADEVIRTAAQDLDEFFHNVAKVNVGGAGATHPIDLQVQPRVDGVHTPEGFRVDVARDQIAISGTTSRGVMRGVYWLEDAVRDRRAPFLKTGATTRNSRFARRLTTSVHPGGQIYTESSRPLIYTDGVLQRISHGGFNAIWLWVNFEEVTLNSKIFPELNDPEAAARLQRLDDVSRRARRYGIDVYLYFATGYHHHLPQSFFDKHPGVRGYGWGPPMCTSVEGVRRFYGEVVQTIFHHAPEVKGLVMIYDSEGFYYCGNSEKTRLECPRCRNHSQEYLAAQLLTTIDDAMHQAGGAGKELIAWDYGPGFPWILKLIPLLPKDIVVQCDFSKGAIVERDGIKERSGDYNLTSVGPPPNFVDQYNAARAAGLSFIAKTEHAVSQEFINVPYIPAMDQWYRRIAKIRDFDVGGLWGNWCHYGFTPSRPAELLSRMSFDPAPASSEEMLQELAERSFGTAAAGQVVRAWQDFSDGIRFYPYSDAVARVPGPIQKGPSNPLFLDPAVKSFGAWRAWQNDLKWTKPWGTDITRKYLGLTEQSYTKGISELEAAKQAAAPAFRPALDSEIAVARTIQVSLRSILNEISWIQARDEFVQATSDSSRSAALERMEKVALAERANAESILSTLQSDSRLGYASEGGGIVRGGLFNAPLVAWKIGEIDDLLLRQIPARTGRPADPVLARKLLGFSEWNGSSVAQTNGRALAPKVK